MIYLMVPFEQKDEVKSLGAKWDSNARKWFVPNGLNPALFEKWLPQSKIKNIKELTEEQQEVIKLAKIGKNILVDACIGSGKTTTIQALCNECSNKKILYLTYNTLLKIDAQRQITALNTYVTNYHGFACKVLGSKCTDYTAAVKQYIEEKPPIDSYDILILDEYQDINEEISEMLKDIKARTPGLQIIAVGDMDQKIYSNTVLDVKAFITEFLGDFEQLSFTYCFRLNKEHAAHLGQLWNKSIVGTNKHCKIRYMKPKDVPEYLNKFEPKEILCLGYRTGEMVKVLNKLETLYPEKFNKNTVYASIQDEDRDRRIDTNSAIFTTYDGAKGMERKVCAVFDYTEKYWDTRIKKPGTSYTVLKNLFLVALSRGKEEIILVKDINDDELEDKTITTYIEMPYTHSDPFDASDMFDFNYAEDIKHCLSLINIKQIETKDTKNIDIENHDGNIDMSPCIGIYTESCFFKRYDIDHSLLRALKKKDFHIEISDQTTLEEKILALVSIETKQSRYKRQVRPPFVNDEQKEEIIKRLKSRFTGDELVQQTAKMKFRAYDNNIYTISCMCDVIKDNVIYELKFASELKESYYLQLAIYLCAFNLEEGYLWNIKDNCFYKVTVPNKEEFLKAAIKSATKRNLRLKKIV